MKQTRTSLGYATNTWLKSCFIYTTIERHCHYHLVPIVVAPFISTQNGLARIVINQGTVPQERCFFVGKSNRSECWSSARMLRRHSPRHNQTLRSGNSWRSIGTARRVSDAPRIPMTLVRPAATGNSTRRSFGRPITAAYREIDCFSLGLSGVELQAMPSIGTQNLSRGIQIRLGRLSLPACPAAVIADVPAAQRLSSRRRLCQAVQTSHRHSKAKSSRHPVCGI